MYRNDEGLGTWEHRGKVAAVGVGHAPTARRWDGRPETCVGAISIQALRQAIDDAGVAPEQIDGLVVVPQTTTGAFWEEGKPLPMDVIQSFQQTDDPLDGVAKISAEWLLANMPELTNVQFTMYGPGCMSNALNVTAQAVGDGLTHTCLVVKSWHNFEGRYYQSGANAGEALSGTAAMTRLWGGPASYGTALQFAEYCRKYGKSHEMMAPFMENSRHNGLMFPEGYWAQHRPEELGPEDYLAARWIAKPASLFDNDIPIMMSGAYPLFHGRARRGHETEAGLHLQSRVQ